MSERNSTVFPLTHLSAFCVAQNNIITDTLPKELQNKVASLQQVLKKPSVVKVLVSLFDQCSLKETDDVLFPHYEFNFPVHNLHAEIANRTYGMEASVSRDFSDIQIEFLSSKNISTANIIDFLSDISGKIISVSNIAGIRINVETEMPAPNSVYFIQHEYRGFVSGINKALKYFKAKNVSCPLHYSESVCSRRMSLLCTDVRLSVFSS